MVYAQEFSLNDPILLKFILYLSIDRKQVGCKRKGYVSICPGVTASDRHKKEQYCFLLNHIRSNKWMSLKFIRYMIINKIQLEFTKGGYASIWPEIKSPERHEKLHFFCFPVNNSMSRNGFL